MAIYSSILVWKISWAEEPPWGCRARLTEHVHARAHAHTHTHTHTTHTHRFIYYVTSSISQLKSAVLFLKYFEGHNAYSSFVTCIFDFDFGL